jgi:hypothetical protein
MKKGIHACDSRDTRDSRRGASTGCQEQARMLDWNKREITRQDWDFRREVCSAEEVQDCFYYEFSRENGVLREAVRKSRKAHPDFESGYARLLGQRPVMSLGEGFFWALSHPEPLAYQISPHWPEKPFLSLDRTNRTEWHLLPWKSPPETGLMVEDLRTLLKNPNSGHRFPLPSGTMWCEESQSEIVAFHIPWRHPTSRIEDAFSTWLRRRQ